MDDPCRDKIVLCFQESLRPSACFLPSKEKKKRIKKGILILYVNETGE